MQGTSDVKQHALPPGLGSIGALSPPEAQEGTALTEPSPATLLGSPHFQALLEPLCGKPAD